jgi:hypothetical protein
MNAVIFKGFPVMVKAVQLGEEQSLYKTDLSLPCHKVFELVRAGLRQEKHSI